MEDAFIKFSGNNVSCEQLAFPNPAAQACAVMAFAGEGYQYAQATEASPQAVGSSTQDRGFGIA
jgi:hypothetical protein